MALTLLEAAKLTQDPLKRGVIEIFPRTSPVLERLPFLSVDGMAYKYNEEKTLPGIGFRNVNESYTESTGVVNPQVEPLFIGGKRPNGFLTGGRGVVIHKRPLPSSNVL